MHSCGQQLGGKILTCNSCDDKNYSSGKYDKICIKMLFDQKSHQV